MSYWGDQRDDLEKLYPTCTTFCRYHASYPEGLIESLPKGVIFLMAFWSGSATKFFKDCCYALEDLEPRMDVEFHVVDFDGLKEQDPFLEFPGLGGNGETFWIKEGRIRHYLGGKDWSHEKFNEFTDGIRKL